jgi:hypothetical protein
MTISFMRSRNRTPLQIIGYGLYLYFLGLSFRGMQKHYLFKCSEVKSRYNLELNTKVQTPEIKEEGYRGIHHLRDRSKTRL